MPETIISILIAVLWTWMLYVSRSQFDGKGWLYEIFGVTVDLDKPENLMYTFFVMLGIHSNLFLEVVLLVIMLSHIVGKPLRPAELVNKLVSHIKK